MSGTMRAKPVRVFADNGQWWVLNAASTAQSDVVVAIVAPTGEHSPLSALCAAWLDSVDQLSMPVPNTLDRQRRTRISVAWRERDQSRSYQVDLPNDGMRDGRQLVTVA